MLAWLACTQCGSSPRSVDDGITEVTWENPPQLPVERSVDPDSASRTVAPPRAAVRVPAPAPVTRPAGALASAAPIPDSTPAREAAPEASASDVVSAPESGGASDGNGSGGGVAAATGVSSPPRRVGTRDQTRGSRARGAALGTSRDWSDCDFPDGDSGGLVRLRVRVRRDGTPAGVTVLDAPHPNLGRYAARCAMSRNYFTALDDSRRPTEAETAPFLVYFMR